MDSKSTTDISDDFMRDGLAAARPYCAVILRAGPRRHDPDAPDIIWEHGRRNFRLREQRTLHIVCPVTDESDVCGIGIFCTDPAETARILEDDPAVKAGVLTYELHPCLGFAGDTLS